MTARNRTFSTRGQKYSSPPSTAANRHRREATYGPGSPTSWALNKDRVVIDHTNTEFGMGKSHGYAKVYETPELAKSSEKNYILARQGMAEKRPKKVKMVKAKAAPKIK